MGKPKAPTPPDPKETAAAQTGTNISTAQANAVLGNVNQITPYGNLTYTQSGNQFVENDNGQVYYRGPNGEIQSSAPMTTSAATTRRVPVTETFGRGGERSRTVYRDEVVPGTSTMQSGWTQVKGNYIPQYTATTSLSPSEQAKFDQSQAAQLNLLQLANQQSKFLQDYLGKPMDYSGIPAGGNAADLKMPQYQQFQGGPQMNTQIADAGLIQKQLGDAGAITRDYGPADGYASNMQAVQDNMMKRLSPQMDQQRAALQTQLANQGIGIGSDAYESAMRQLNQGQNDQRTSVALAAGQEQSRLANLDAQRAGFQNAAQQQQYNQLLGSGQFANAAQQQQFGQNAAQGEFGNSAMQQMFQNQNTVTGQNNALQDQTLNAQLSRFNAQNQQHQMALQEAYAKRQQPINEIIGLMGGAPIQQPNFVNTNMPTIPNVDYAGLVNDNYNQKLGIYNQQMQASQGLLGGILGLGSAFLGNPALKLSTREAKENIRKVGETKDGQNLYAYQYKGDPTREMHIGLIAEEVERAHPRAVVDVGGVKHVDYGKALKLGSVFGLKKEAA